MVHAGYGASLPQKAGDTAQAKAQRPEAQMEAELSSMKHRLIWSFVFLIPLFYISMGHMLGAPLPGFLTGLENAVALRPDPAAAHPAHYVHQRQILPGGV